MPRSRIFAIYGLLAVFALGSGLLIARFFGTSAVLPSGYVTPGATVSQLSTEPPAPTAPSAGQVAAVTPSAAPSPTPGATPAPTTAAPPTAPATEVPAPTVAPPTAPPATEVPAPTAAADYVEYTVQRGDSLKIIAGKYGVTIRDIIAVNQIPNPDSLTVGSVLRIPKK
jgi:LysM repeat protein